MIVLCPTVTRRLRPAALAWILTPQGQPPHAKADAGIWRPRIGSGSLPGVRVLVTGAAGFVGQRLLAELEAQGHESFGIDVECDIRDPRAVARSVRGSAPQALIHLAGLASVASSHAAAEDTFAVNYVGARSILEAVRQEAPQCRVLLVGSGEVYGNHAPGGEPFREEAAFTPGSPYANSKACADRMGAAYRELGLDVVRVRPFNHIGPGQHERFVVPSFARQLAEIAGGRKEAILRTGNLDCVRDFLDVEDVLSAYLALLVPASGAGPFNIASGVGLRIGALLDTLCAIAGLEPEIETDPTRFRPTDHSVGDASALRQATGWRPQVDLNHTLERVYRHELERLQRSGTR
ncbi:MAG: GDP-mannose 4,6-dehydratase [Myxococcota bacterium]